MDFLVLFIAMISVGMGLYILTLLVEFLKEGTRAFKTYNRLHNKGRLK